MQDAWVEIGRHPLTRAVLKRIGLSSPPPLLRSSRAWSDDLLRGKRVLVNQEGDYGRDLVSYLHELKAQTDFASTFELLAPQQTDSKPHPVDVYQGTVYDATHISTVAQLKELYRFFHPHLRKLGFNHRMVVLLPSPTAMAAPEAHAAAQAIEGFVRSLTKEIGPKAVNINAIWVPKDATSLERLKPLVAFFLSDFCAFITGQVLHLSLMAQGSTPQALAGSLAGKRALVTGAAQGIGYAISRRLAEEGAHVIGLDRANNAEALQELARNIDGESMIAELGGPAALTQVLEELQRRPSPLDIIVHNAGVTRDRSLFAMQEKQWDQVLQVNLEVVVNLTQAILHRGLLAQGGRIICMSSIVGIAGNYGQTNYAASKAGLIGFVEALATHLARQGVTAHAVAPGFIETPMTANLPFLAKQVARRLSSLAQGGVPDDVAELVTFLASPCSQGVNGSVVRVCGGSFLGA